MEGQKVYLTDEQADKLIQAVKKMNKKDIEALQALATIHMIGNLAAGFSEFLKAGSPFEQKNAGGVQDEETQGK